MRAERRSQAARGGTWLVAAAVLCASGAARGDLVKLKSGGEIRGAVEHKVGADEHAPLVIRTLTGGTVVVARDQVHFVTWRKPIVEEYETRAKTVAETVEAHWELAEWCRQNGLTVQRELHLYRVVDLEPDHAQARAALQHVRHGGEWMSRDESMAAQGYVRHKGRWVTQQELDLIEKTAAQLADEQKWFKDVRLWTTWLGGRNAERREAAYAELKAIEDPAAVPAVERLLRDDQDRNVRKLCVEILAKVGGPRAVPSLVHVSLNDADYELRYQALNGLKEDQYAAARPLFARQLLSSNNEVVRRAGSALGRVGDAGVVPQLIEALVTSHKYQVKVATTQGTMSFGSNGSFGPGAGGAVLPPEIEALLRTGQLPYGVQINYGGLPNQHVRTKTVLVKYDHRNTEVASALQKLTGENFGYDERTWRLWWAAKKNGALGPAPGVVVQ